MYLMFSFVSLLICVNLLVVKSSNQYLKENGLMQCNNRRLDKGAKIIGGEATKPMEFPWQVSLQVKQLSSHNCGAALISDQWVLTAAHCMRKSSSPNYWKVKLGEHNLSKFDKTEREFNISRVFIHEKYSSTNQINDITLLKLATKVDLNGKDNHLKPICLAPKSLKLANGQNCVATGWGKSKSDEKLSNILLKISQTIIDQKECIKSWPGIQWPISEGHVCAAISQEGKGVCSGDSGGPLQCKASDGQWIQVGIASWTANPCATKGYASIFTSVSHHYDWIMNKISTN